MKTKKSDSLPSLIRMFVFEGVDKFGKSIRILLFHKGPSSIEFMQLHHHCNIQIQLWIETFELIGELSPKFWKSKGSQRLGCWKSEPGRCRGRVGRWRRGRRGGVWPYSFAVEACSTSLFTSLSLRWGYIIIRPFLFSQWKLADKPWGIKTWTRIKHFLLY